LKLQNLQKILTLIICKLGKHKKYFVVNETEIQAKPNYCYFREEKKNIILE